MAKKPSTGQPPAPLKLTIPRSEAQAKIETWLQKGEEIKNLPINSNDDANKAKAEETKWRDYTITLLKNIFNNTSKADDYEERTRQIAFFTGPVHYSEQANSFRHCMRNHVTELESILGTLELIPEFEGTTLPQARSYHNPSLSKNVFIVHGHDITAKEAVARFMHQLDLNPIILDEQPSEGQTVIEKFEKSSDDVGYAVILLTPDDIGTSQNNPEELKPRARQNVIFELGYFAAKLGRKRICALHKGGIEIPSDYHGIIYVSMDSADWKMRLARELKQVIPIDLNKAFP